MIDDAWIAQRAGVAEARGVAFRDLAQDAAHDLSRARLGQSRSELEFVGGCDRADLGAYPAAQLVAQVVAMVDAVVECDIGVDALTFTSCGMPTTAASATCLCSTSALSTSAVPIRCPLTLITSSTRPVIQ